MARSDECVYLSVAIPKDSPLLAYLRQRRVATRRHESQQIVDMAMNFFEMINGSSLGGVGSHVSSSNGMHAQTSFLQGPTEEVAIDFESFGDPDE